MVSFVILAGMLATFLFPVNGDHNVTIDDGDPSITYVGGWSVTSQSGDYGGSHHYADTDLYPDDHSASASFTFTGIAIYFMAPLWPYTVNTVVTVDDYPPALVDMTDPFHSEPVGNPPSAASTVIWGMSGLANTQHKIVMSMASSGIYIVVDALIYTVQDPTTTPALSPSTSSASSSTATALAGQNVHPSNNRSLQPTTKIVIGAVCGVTGLALIIFAAFLIKRQRPRKEPEHADYQNTNAFGAGGGYQPNDSPPQPTIPTPLFPELPSMQGTYHAQPVSIQQNVPSQTTYPEPSRYQHGYVPPTADVYNRLHHPSGNYANYDPAVPSVSASGHSHLPSAYSSNAQPRAAGSDAPPERSVSASEVTRFSVISDGSSPASPGSVASVERLLPKQAPLTGYRSQGGLYPPDMLQEKFVADQKQFDPAYPGGVGAFSKSWGG